jgi:hypothetical protein
MTNNLRLFRSPILKLLLQNLLSFHSQFRTTFNPELGTIRNQQINQLKILLSLTISKNILYETLHLRFITFHFYFNEL